jgi:D-alanine-D-alanine ligase
MSGRLRLVLLYGGQSAEHDVSCVSAESLLGAIDRERYDVTTERIEKDGRWEHGDPFAALRAADVVFPLLHGPMGEDGTVQGMLEVVGVPYVGCGVLSSAISMDKIIAKQVLDAAGLPQVSCVPHRLGIDAELDPSMSWPRFVKPANMGSSVGVSKVHDDRELAAAMELAGTYDEWVLVEEGVVGAREVECAVLGGLQPEATHLGEIVPKADWYDYEDKYSGEGAELFVPADVPDAVHAEAQALAVRAFQALRCDGLARVDFFYEEGGRGLLINEINTMPGFTPYSMYPQLWANEGLPYPRLVDRLIDLALERHARRASHRGRTR